jgi:hypothetical protein
MRLLAFFSVSLAVLAIALAGYTSGCNSNSDECSAAGGHCVLGLTICAVHGSQTCGSGLPNPDGTYCCLADTADCGQPSATTYACPALDSGVASEVQIRVSHLCKGGPPSMVFPGNPDDTYDAGSNDASYPLYCTATLPVCSNGQAVSCTCSVQGEAGVWDCFF